MPLSRRPAVVALLLSLTLAAPLRLAAQTPPPGTIPEVQSLLDKGMAAEDAARHEEALRLFEAALEKAIALKDRVGESDVRFNIGVVYIDLGQPQKALPYYQQAMALYEQTGIRAGVAATLSNIGQVYHVLSQPQKALQYYQQAQSIARTLGNKQFQANTLTNIGLVYSELGQPKRALQYYRQALPLHRNVGNKLFEANTLHNMGIVYAALGQPEKALQTYQQVLALYKQTGNRGDEAATLSTIGIVYADLGQPRKALQTYRQALPLYKRTGDRSGEAALLTNIGVAHYLLGQPMTALKYHQQALLLHQAFGNKQFEVNTLTNIGLVYSHLGQPKKALEGYQQAIERLETLRASLGGLSEAKSSLLASNLYTYQQCLALLLRQSKTGDAFNLTQKMKARVLLDLMYDAKVLLAQSLSPEERDKERELRDTADRLNAAMLAESVQNEVGAKKRFAALKQQLAKAESDLQTYTDALYSRHPQLAQKRAARTVTLSEVGCFLPADTALLEYIVLNVGMGKDRQDKTVLLVTTVENGKPQVRGFSLKRTSASLTRQTEAFRQVCADPRRSYRPLARQLYRLLLAPAARQLIGKKRLVICPDGPLWDVPFQALLASLPSRKGRRLTSLVRTSPPARHGKGGGGAGFLAERFEIVYAYSATGAQAALTAKHRKSARSVLALVNPDMGEETRFGDNPVIPGQRPLDTPSRPLETPSRPLESPSRPLDAPSRDLWTHRGGKLLALPGTQQEGQTLQRLFADAIVYSGKEAQEATAKEQAAQYRYLHLASHAFFNDAAPLLSSVILAQPSDDKEDGFLTAREIFDLDLKAEMVVLSACNTARGEKRSGEGVVGLIWALFVAGTPTQVLSQWSVDDTSTVALMSGFYERLKAGKAKGQALREAGLALMQIRAGKYRHPYYWAPFVLMGDWR